ncbi:MAG: exo-beta-N-acetylmuramidase NamZ domain-containing protein [Limisphaerales bacterium]
MDAAIARVIAEHHCPGGVLWLERGGAAYHRAYGQRALVPAEETMTEDTIFDAASLTKVIATTPAIMLLIERGQVKLDAPAQSYIPEFKGDGKETITIRQLMTHTSGLRPDLSLNPRWSGYDTAVRLACAERLQSTPGTEFRYSDINFFLLGEIVRRVTGQQLNEFVAREIYEPLRMVDTGFLPSGGQRPRIAPTEFADGQMLRGTVHDPTARRMGGVAGHAGLFTTAADLARYARMLLKGGALDGVRIFRAETVELMTSVQSPGGVHARRGLGWDIDSGYSRPRGAVFPIGSFGHTGFTGTCLWLDPFSQTFWILLSNRVHPDGQGNILPLEAELGTLAAQSVIGFNFAYVPGALAPQPSAATATARREPSPNRTVQAEVLNGIDVLEVEHFAPLKGLRVGLITNHTGVDRHRRPTIDLLKSADGVKLVALFSPEHGIRGAFDETVGDSVDEKTGLPIYSLYGERHAPTPEQLRDLDALVFDIQDVGCRFYTYTTTMGLSLEAAAKAGKKFFVLDRVNPINGVAINGPVLDGPHSFTGLYAVPVRYGMTIGEEARMFDAERGLHADLTVIPVKGWERDSWFDQTGLPWINPSPNMRSLTEATLYPGVGLLETTALSVGRGTDTPFEVVGAPYIDDLRLAAELNRAGLSGVRFVPVRFTPTASVFKGKPCAGVNLLLTDRDRCDVVDLGVTIAQTLHRLYPRDFDIARFNRLLVHPATIEAIKAGKSQADIRQTWTPDLEKFKQRRAPFLLY